MRASAPRGELSENTRHRRLRSRTIASSADTRTAEACAEVARLREELAAANEERDLDRRLLS